MISVLVKGRIIKMIVSISGFIGVGKFSLAHKLSQHYKNSILIDDLNNSNDIFEIFLNWFYNKKENINLGFQAYIIEETTQKFNNAFLKFQKSNLSSQGNYIFSNRFNLEHYIFALISMKDKPPKYLRAFDKMFVNMVYPKHNPQLAIFIDVNYEMFENYIFSNPGSIESQFYTDNIEYFKELHALYRDLYTNLMQRWNIPFAIIDANNKNEYEILGEAIKIIDNFNFNWVTE
ncbi:deoxyguanosine kinase [Mycoplasmopsis californica HAZ160_1]|uniref:Deoxyguanosine kinase n=1 Tax=Mycoplasmopsis californica HAZ160_1 TaxID=1397850 RepID=A0AAT9F7Q5_9BACT|nr:deoxynucleoside kinase [Mycoplasmopsis californica]BAP00897.1 deoxyguanosine kinase [Mycoplasmopsis californica HAZ160_1]BBG40756.1 deoxyguanosine kinase [Mycoplasmopsis californica]BBG41350.1 deoxyguanosine kinase [Mycoplasmopsis californica]BBG41943.1 deoxyguanosine kinase [Mycoplasmopsis californica]BBG42532.1 deoxyguanosine kinase [Mycoplasmopsis californica]